ncbi:S-layer homology domain-containing protein [Intestinibacillus sp. NTUH-41-i26]|uniref:S-layer homology domain-containing protein n=1 Tax=Intestinibacillus sp. NTUH-41-i26 TaxID=3079303 RepID=UPI002934E60A|nr:S-layer homology domain-containing protein [Intestinibacillus sp. NTUH-41-i26]WOC75621.1 S-layer homology domain-containing protein [Intestinibacillus sp. NTUH-41-i26]
MEEPALPTEPEQPVEMPEQPDNQPEQPAETPEQPTDEPGTDTETPEAPEETPGESEPQPEPVPEVPDTPEKPPVEEPEVTEPPAEKPAPDEEPADEPAAPAEDMPPAEAAPVPLAAVASVRSVGVSPLSTPLNSQNGDAAVQAVGDSSIIVHDEATPAGSSFTYRVRVKYAGDTGAQSGRIELAFPLPEKVAQSITETDIEVSDIEYSDGSSGGFKGGQIVKQPYLDESDPSNPVLRGTFEGLYTGNEIEITITCTNQSKTAGEDGYTYWDAIAYAQDSAGSAVSNVYRLWDKEDGTKPEPSNQHTLTYAFAGEVPPDAVLPHGGVYTSGNTVSIAAKPTTSYEYYEFSGWVRSDTQATVTPGETGFSMPDNDLTLTGTWKIKEESAPKITVTYQYTSENDAQHVPNGAPELPGEIVSGDGEQHVHAQEIMVGDNHAIISILEHADNHIFGGWVPTLTIGGQEVTLSGPDRDGVYTGTHNEKTYTINTTGLLHTEQFRDATDVTVAFKGAWRPYTGTIQFDANGGEGTMQPMKNVTWDTKTQYLTQNQFTYPVAGYTFTGWATAPSGKVVKEDGALADGLIDKDGKTVTLYAVWKQTSFEVGYALSHVTSSSAEKTVARGGTYETTLTPESGYEMKSVSIQMGGMELASNSSIYNPATGKVNITDVSGDIIIRATAEAKTEPPTPVKHTITVSVTGGTASPSGAVQVEDGKDQTITFTPNSGYELKSVTVDNAPASLTGNSYTFTNVTADHSIAVVYEKDNSGGGSGGGGGGGGSTTTDKYPVHVETDGSGTADSNKDKAASGETVTITTEGVVESITATADKTGKEIALTDKGNGKYTFKMPSSAVTVKVQFEQKPEIPSVADPDGTGVSSMLNTREHIAYMVGYETGNFGPANNITRAEVAQAFYRLLLDQSHSQSPSFPDVAADAWYHEAVVTLAAKGIITGYEDGTFRPEQPITRSEFAAIAARFARASTDKALTFPDVPADAWYRGAVQTAVSYGWINGYEDGTFRPEQPIGRAETAAIINRMLARIADRSAVDNGAGTRFPDVPASHWAFYDVVEASTEHDYTRDSNTAEESWSK